MTFIHLHNHSHYSILEWLPKPEQYVKKAKQLGMEAVALTDTSNLHWCHEFYKACKSEWIKPILWTEIFVESSLDPKISHKLVLLSKDLDWYRNIIQLVTKANLDNPWTRAKIKFEDIIELKEKCSGASCVSPDLKIIALSWPISWEIPFYILSWKADEEILERIKQYQNVFGIDDFYLELLEHSDVPKQELVTKELIRISEKYKIPVVAAQNTHYINKEDNTTQDVIKALGTWHELENPDRPTLINWDYSFLSEEDMQMLFWFIPEALENTKKIADKINIEIETGGILIPTFELPESDEIIYNKALKLEKSETDSGNIKKLDSSEWYLRYLSFKWLNSRFDFGLDESTIFELIKKLDKPSLNKKLTETLPEELKTLSLTYYTDKKKEIIWTYTKNWQEIIDRLEYELVVVHEMWFDAYFLIVADYINWARNNEIPVGPGRWSAAWSLMAYLSWITDLDPLKYDLLFERFLNPARVSMPDIDTDFADSELYKVVDYCIEKYWADKVVRVCTFGTFAARAAVKDVWRVYGIPFAEMNALVKTIPEKPWTKLKWAIEDSVEFAEAYEDKRYTKLIDNALKIEWNVRQLWVHACAVIIAPEPMTKFTALQHPPKDENSTVTQYSAYPLEDLGLLKMDFLGLRNLTIIKRARKIIELNKWEKIDILNLDMSDEKALQVFVDWDTSWVFQFESDWMRKYLRDLKPNSFNDLIAMVSLYRPGPIAYIPNYIDRKYGREEVQYMTSDLKEIMTKAWYDDKVIEEQKLMLEEDLKKILDVTYWIAVYQEQLMFIVQYMAWFSLWEADLLRRWVWKKKLDVIEALKKEFKTKWESYRWYKPEVTQYIYEEMIQPAANYSFNKSHAACYALISYQTAYLKAYYPTEFLTSLMVSDEENMDRIEMEVWECEVKWISVLAPNINSSLKHFTYVDDKTIIFWLKAIKWIWDGPINRIIETRKEIWWVFEDLEHFIESCWKEVINKKTLEALIRSWAMDSFEERNKMLSSIPSMIAFSRKDEKKKETNQIWLFDNSSTFEEKLKLEDSIVMDFEEKLTWEKEVIWFWISGHPLDGLGRYCARRGQNIKKLKMSFEELSRLEKLENPENQETSPQASPEVEVVEQKKVVKEKSKNLYNEWENCQVIWVITDFRKIFTKTWKVMMFLKCEWYDYEFEVVLFAKDVEKYAEKIDNFKIIIVNWFLDINLEYSRKSVKPRDIKIVSISQVRDQARDMWFLDENIKRFKNNDLNIVEEYSDTTDDFENKLEEKILDSKVEKKEKNQVEQYIIDVPKNAKRQDLVDLKEFLLSKKSWDIEVFINLNWGKVSTKISLKDTSDIERRVRKNIFN
jgi:DNA polymerase-3 subunit alpha